MIEVKLDAKTNLTLIKVKLVEIKKLVKRKERRKNMLFMNWENILLDLIHLLNFCSQ